MEQDEQITPRPYDAVVIGGGAAGLMAAGTAASAGCRVLLLEKMEKTGRKVRITGKGRCNLTNLRPAEEFFGKVRANAEFLRPALTAFDARATCRFFERLGVKLERERGERVFPASGKAWDVAQALVDWCREEGVQVQCGARVEEILTICGKAFGVLYRNKRGFQRKVEAPNIILATGGITYPATGSTGDGYGMVHGLGHAIEPVRPSLVPLETSYPLFGSLAGLKLRNIGVTLVVDGTAAGEEFGEIAFSSRGVEGPVILQLSRDAVDALIDERSVQIVLDLKPALSAEVLCERIERERQALGPTECFGELLRKLVPQPLLLPLAREVDVHPKTYLGKVEAERFERLAAVLKHLALPITDYRPVEEAVVTAGGIGVGQVDPETMQSTLIKGLYFAGEVLDVDADTGGYNLQIAFSTGRLAGQLKKRNGAPVDAPVKRMICD